MTRDEQRKMLVREMDDAYWNSGGSMLAALDAIGVAGYCVNHPEATDEMLSCIPVSDEAVNQHYRDIFCDMTLKGNLAGPER